MNPVPDLCSASVPCCYFFLFIRTRYRLPQCIFLHSRSFDFPRLLTRYPREVLFLLPHDGHRDGCFVVMDVSPLRNGDGAG